MLTVHGLLVGQNLLFKIQLKIGPCVEFFFKYKGFETSSVVLLNFIASECLLFPDTIIITRISQF